MSQTYTPIDAGSMAGDDVQSGLNKLQQHAITGLCNTGGLAIKSGGSALAKTVNTIRYFIRGNLYSKAAADMAALSGTVLNGKFGGWVFFVDTAGTLTSVAMTAGDTLADVVLPAASFDGSKCPIGMLIVNPTGTGNFVGGTTALDDGTVVPNAVYIDMVKPVWPALILA